MGRPSGHARPEGRQLKAERGGADVGFSGEAMRRLSPLANMSPGSAVTSPAGPGHSHGAMMISMHCLKVGFLYSATKTVEPEQSRKKWQLIGKSQWCCGAMRPIHCPC